MSYFSFLRTIFTWSDFFDLIWLKIWIYSNFCIKWNYFLINIFKFSSVIFSTNFDDLFLSFFCHYRVRCLYYFRVFYFDCIFLFSNFTLLNNSAFIFFKFWVYSNFNLVRNLVSVFVCTICLSWSYFYNSVFWFFSCCFSIYWFSNFAVYYSMSYCSYFFTKFSFLFNLSCTWFQWIIYNIFSFKFYDLCFLSFKSTCVVFLTNFDHCIYWFFCYFLCRSFYYFRILNSPSSCLFSSYTFCYYLVVIFCIWVIYIEVRIILYIIFKWYFFLVLYLAFSICTYFYNFLFRCFCFGIFAFIYICNLTILDCDSCSSSFFSRYSFLCNFLFTWC